MSNCKRCGKKYVKWPDEFCFSCNKEFNELVRELRAGFIADWDENKLNVGGKYGKI